MATSSGRRPGIGGKLEQPLVEAGSLDQLHAEEMPSLVLADLVDRHDVRVVELGDGLGLILKSQQLGFRGENARLDQLEGDRPIERDLAGFQDNAHSPSPQLAQDFIARQTRFLSRTERQIRPAAISPIPVAMGSGEVTVDTPS